MWYIYRECYDGMYTYDEYIDCIEDIDEANNFIKTLNKAVIDPCHLYFKVPNPIPEAMEI